MAKPFKGVISLDGRDSIADWSPYVAEQAPEGAPNVFLVLYDDTGLAAWSPFGGRIEMPTLQRLADDGLMYSQWHTTALCSPTRSCLLTGRNHHQNGFAQSPRARRASPGTRGTEVLREKGWNTFWLGKNHYGFIGGETNQWYPTLVEDNHYIEQPYQPEDGYHLSKELADKGIGFIRDSKQSHPDKPWFMWFCPVANHAPHHAPLPEGKVIEGDAVRPWDTLSDGEKRLFARMAEVYAGYSKYTDHQVGRIVDYLEESGQLDNTLIVYCADNGASDEGSPSGSVNENKFFNAWPDDIEQNLTMLDKLGGPDAYNHYPTGWAAAFSTPFRMFKRYSYQGGVSDPLVIHWPKGIQTKGEVREQYHHCTDIVPTILDCCGVEFPDFVQGYEQTPLPGVSMRYSFDDADAPTTKRVQYYEMMGTRGLWNEGWKVVAERGPLIGTGNYENDRWQLFHTDEDRSEAHDHR